jgi:serine/threonine-protein kinase
MEIKNMKMTKAGSSEAYDIIDSNMLQIGDPFDQYQVLGHIAKGGMSDIYRAFDLVNRRDVVIKIPDASIMGDPAQYERFQRELEVLNTLDHPAILKGLGSGRYNRIPYLVTAFLEGRSLRDVISEDAPMATEKVIPIMLKIAEGMAYCHANGIVHRDLKPENIILSSDGQPVIMDFGLALTKKAHRVTYSNLSSTMGTPDYMAPEQIEGQRGDARTDIYALGTMLFEMVSGQLPFTGDSNLAVMAQRMNKAAPRLDHLQAGVSASVAAIAAQCLQHDAARRFQSMEELVAALQHPETVDLSVLESSTGGPTRWQALMHSTAFKAIAISLAIFGAMLMMAFVLQGLR